MFDGSVGMEEGGSPEDQCTAGLTRKTVAWTYHPLFQTLGLLLALIGAIYWLAPQIPPEAWAQLSFRGFGAGAAVGGLLSLPWLRFWLKRLPALNHAARQNPVFFLERTPQTMPREVGEIRRATAWLLLIMAGSLLAAGKGLLNLPTATLVSACGGALGGWLLVWWAGLGIWWWRLPSE
jgi:hypothetical protein